MSRLAAQLAALLLAASPFQAEEPRVREGNEKLLSGDAAGALDRYQAAEQEAGARPEIDFDRGNALYAQGRHAEARQAWTRALEQDRAGTLSSRALQNMGNALDAAGDHEGAIRAFSEALRRDPGNEDARYNLEVLQRRKATGQGKPQDPGDQGRKQEQDPQRQQGGQQPRERGTGQEPEERQGQQAPKPQGGQDEERRAGKRREQAGAAEGQGERGQPRTGQQPGARPEELGRQDAERLLDALRDRERNMPLEPATRKDARRRDVEKDW
jgi:tetratricopeptide (TPR) repeat protein